MSNHLQELKNKFESLKNRSPEKFLLLMVLLIGVFFLWSYIIFFLPEEDTAAVKDNNLPKVSDAKKEDFNFANDNKDDKIDSKGANKQQADKNNEQQFRDSPFEYPSQTDSSLEEVFVYQGEEVEEEKQKEQESLDLEELFLQGIIITQNNELATIEKNNKIYYYRINDQLEGYSIAKIDFDSVILKGQTGNRYKLQFED